jgi:hypothetical protein
VTGNFEHLMASAKAWDEVLARRDCKAALLKELEGLPESSLKAARVAQVHLVNGRSDFALQALARAKSNDLVWAARLAIYAARNEYAKILGLEIVQASGEARTRSLLARACALWSEHRLTEASQTAREAMCEALSLGMMHFANVCERLIEDCQALQLEVLPAVREQELRHALDRSVAAEEQLETRIDLTQLMYRQGRYDESMRLSQEIPVGRRGRFFQDISLIVNGRGDSVNWKTLEGGLDYGRLHAVYGLMRLDPTFVLAGPEPRDEDPLTPRHVAEWLLAFAWAAMRTGDHQRAMRYLEQSFVYRTEWDLRLMRALIWLELFVRLPALMLSRCNVPAMLHDAQRLLHHYVAPDSVLVQSLTKAVPLAVALLVATEDGCEVLEARARADLVVLSARGLTVNGMTRTRADALVRVASGTELERPALTKPAIRSARYRLKQILIAHNQPLVVHEEAVHRALRLISKLP